jgi:small-conductance mechanosensitive channel
MLVQYLFSALVGFSISSIFVYGLVLCLHHIKGWPKPVAWFRGFVLPAGIFAFLLIAKNFSEIREQLNHLQLEQWARVAMILSGLWFFLSTVRFCKRYFRNRFDISSEDNWSSRMQQTRLQFIEKLSFIVLSVIATGAVLLCFDTVRKFGESILASAGIAGLVIGFASQRIVANLLAGFQIAFSQPIRIEDAVVIDGEWGWVEEITLTYVVIRLWDLRRLIVPLTRLLEKPFENWTRKESKLLGSVFLQVSYLVTVDEIRNQLEVILKETPLWEGNVKAVQVTDSKLNSMEVRILVSARNSSRAFDLRCLVREKMIEFLMHRDALALGAIRIHEEDVRPEKNKRSSTEILAEPGFPVDRR